MLVRGDPMSRQGGQYIQDMYDSILERESGDVYFPTSRISASRVGCFKIHGDAYVCIILVEQFLACKYVTLALYIPQGLDISLSCMDGSKTPCCTITVSKIPRTEGRKWRGSAVV